MNHLENRTPQQANSQATTQATNQRNQSSNVPKQNSIEEHRNLFGYQPPTVTRSSNRQPPSNRMVVTTSTGERVSIPVRNTWSRTILFYKRRKQ